MLKIMQTLISKKQAGGLNIYRLLISTAILMLLGVTASFAQKSPGYTLYSIQGSNKAVLLDTNGNEYHSWTFASNARTGYSFYLLQGGKIIRTVSNNENQLSGGGTCGRVQTCDWNGNVLWDFVYSSSTYCTHHDICPLPNGNVLMISYDVKTANESLQAGSSKNSIIWSEKIIEVQPTGQNTGTIVWEWKVWDHLVQSVNPAKDNYYSSVSEHPELININYNTQKDWMHMNGIAYNPTLDQIVFSSHNFSEIYVIDHSTTTAEAAGHTGGNSGKGGDILYRWGNPAVYSQSGTKVLNVCHDAHWIPAGFPNGNSLVAFNNGGAQNKSTVDIITPPYNEYNYNKTTGSQFEPTSYAFRHTCNGRTNNMGGSQQFSNGNILVTIAQSGLIYEVNSAGTVLWSKQLSGSVAKVHKYTEDFISGISASSTATPSSVCQGNSVLLDVTPTGATNYSYSWTSNPAGFTSSDKSPTVNPTVTTTYTVTVSSGTYSTSADVTVIVFPKPDKPTILRNGNTLTATTASKYQWYLEDAPIASGINKSFTPEEFGTYYVQIINEHDCESELSDPYLYNFNSITDNSHADKITIFPNPTNGVFSISGFDKNEFEAVVCNSLGNIMLKSNDNVVDLSGLNDGLYILLIFSSGELKHSSSIVLIK